MSAVTVRYAGIVANTLRSSCSGEISRAEHVVYASLVRATAASATALMLYVLGVDRP